MTRVYISSTFRDLQQHRQIVHTVVRRFGYEDVAMEYYVTEDQRPLNRCLADVTECDLYIGVYAWRYGYVPEENNPEQLSITELEYRRAVERDRPRLLFVIDEDADWPTKLVDIDRSRVAAFHERVRKDRMTGTFSSPDTLEARLSAALEQRSGTSLRATGIEISSYVKFLRRRYNILDLDALTDPKRDELLQLRVQSVFVEQSAREDPPPMELPKETWEMLLARADVQAEDLPQGLTEEMLRELRASYAVKPSKAVLDVLAAADVRCAIVLGDPGSGKSTLLRFITMSLIDSAENPRLQPGLAARVPFLVDLKGYVALRGQKRCDTFFGYFDILAKEENCPATGAALKRYLENRQPSVILFDGIDEIFDPAEQEAITRQIIAFAEEYPDARIIVTSRIIGYRRALLTQAGFRHYTLQDLDEAQVNEFITQWYTLTLSGNNTEAKERIERIRQSFASSASIRQLAGNPMLLTIMAIIGKHQELPRERWKLYDHATSVLVQHWDVRKHLADKQLGSDLMDEEDKKELLRRLAYAMQRGKGGLAGNYIHANELQAEFEEYLRERYALAPDRAKIIAREMIAQFRARNFILSSYGANLYGFVHRAFLEFFCADAIRMKFEKTREVSLETLKIEIFKKHYQEKVWHEVLRLICGMIGEEFAGELIEHLRALPSKDSRGGNIKLAIECLNEVRRIDVIAEVALRLLQTLFSWGSEDTPSEIVVEVFEAAAQIGPRWPGREWIAEWITADNDPPPAWRTHYYRVGDCIRAIASGSPAIHHTAIAHLSRNVSGHLAIVLVQVVAGSRDDETADFLLQLARGVGDTSPASTYALAEFFKHRPDVVDWIFTKNGPVATTAIALYLGDDPRAVPVLIEAATRMTYLHHYVVRALEIHIHRQDAQDTLRQIANNNIRGVKVEDEVRAHAAKVLRNHDIPLKPPKARHPRAKRPSP